MFKSNVNCKSDGKCDVNKTVTLMCSVMENLYLSSLIKIETITSKF